VIIGSPRGPVCHLGAGFRGWDTLRTWDRMGGTPERDTGTAEHLGHPLSRVEHRNAGTGGSGTGHPRWNGTAGWNTGTPSLGRDGRYTGTCGTGRRDGTPVHPL